MIIMKNPMMNFALLMIQNQIFCKNRNLFMIAYWVYDKKKIKTDLL